MKTHTKILVAAAAASLAVGVLAAMPWKNPKVVKELGLTAQQQQQLEELSYKQQREKLDAKYQLDQKRLALRQEMDKDTPSEAAVNKAIDEMTAAQARMEKMRFAHLQAMRTILTPEQWSKMKQQMAEHREQRGERMGGMCGGRGQGRGPEASGPGGPGGGMAMGGPEGPEDPPPPPPEEGDGGDRP